MTYYAKPISRPKDCQEGVSRRAASKSQTREKILAAGKRLFSKVGYERATIRDIAAEAGMSTGAVFTSFSGKFELFGELVVVDRADTYETIRRALERKLENLEAQVDELLFAVFESAYRRGVGHLPFLQETMSAAWSSDRGAEVRERLARNPVTELIARALEAGVERGQIAPDADIALLSTMLWNSAIGMLPHAVFDRWPLAKMVDQLKAETRVILAGARAKRS